MIKAVSKNIQSYAETYLGIVVLELLAWNIATGDPIDIVNAILIGAFTGVVFYRDRISNFWNSVSKPNIFFKYAETILSIVVLEMLVWNIATADPIDIVNSFLVGVFTAVVFYRDKFSNFWKSNTAFN